MSEVIERTAVEKAAPVSGHKDAVEQHYDQVRAIFDILNGKREADLLLKNLNILDVHAETVYQGSILVYDKRIVALNPDEKAIKVRQVFDGEGLYAIPGLIDAHISSTACTPFRWPMVALTSCPCLNRISAPWSKVIRPVTASASMS